VGLLPCLTWTPALRLSLGIETVLIELLEDSGILAGFWD
jgi:hypothetical protein